jgi:hypothetical protein
VHAVAVESGQLVDVPPVGMGGEIEGLRGAAVRYSQLAPGEICREADDGRADETLGIDRGVYVGLEEVPGACKRDRGTF